MPPRSSGPVHPLILSAGLNGSGSTWVFNMIVEILGRANPALRVHTAYSDDFLEDVSRPDSDTTVVKTHSLPPVARTLALMARIPIILTVREPKDGVASLMRRFDLDYREALESVRRSSVALTPLANAPGVLTLRYEDGFTNNRETLDAIAAHLNLALSRKERAAIWRTLTPKAVRAVIDKLAADGAFADTPAAATFDSRTHWHPGHVGDGRVGSWRDVLSAREASGVDRVAAAFVSRSAMRRVSRRPRRAEPVTGQAEDAGMFESP